MKSNFKHHLLFLTALLLSSISLNCMAQEADGEVGGHEYVDLGLPSKTLWATCNVGSTSPYEGGDIFAWGETTPKRSFSWADYKYFNGVKVDPRTGEYWEDLEDIGDNICGTEYDAARVLWGDGWRLPNNRDLREVWAHCPRAEWVTEEGVNGVRLYGRNGHSIFLPACGFGFWDASLAQLEGYVGPYWYGVSSPFNTFRGDPIEPSPYAKIFIVDSSGFVPEDRNIKAGGLHIRPVISRMDIGLGVDVTAEENVCLEYRDGCLHLNGKGTEFLVWICDLSGRIVFRTTCSGNICDLPVLSKGIYTVSCSGRGGIVTKKITVN